MNLGILESINKLPILGDNILLSEDFSGTSVDTNNGTVTNPDSTKITISQNEKLFFTRTTDTNISGFSNSWDSVNSFNKGVVAVLMNREVGFLNSAYACRWIFQGTRISPTHFISIQRGNSTTQTRLAIVNEGSIVSDQYVAISPNNRFKIVYDSSTNQITYFYWNVSSWSQIGVSYTVDLGTGGFVQLTTTSFGSDAPGDQFSFDELRVTDADYTTELP